MTIDESTLTTLHHRMNTVAVAVLGDAIDGNQTAHAIHRHIMNASQLAEQWFNDEVDQNEWLVACQELDTAIDLLINYADNLAESLIMTRYWLERAPQ